MARKGKISELYDLKSILDQHKEVLRLINEFVAKVDASNSAKVGLKEATKPSEIISGIDALKKKQEDLAETIKEGVETNEKLTESLIESGQTTNEFAQETEKAGETEREFSGEKEKANQTTAEGSEETKKATDTQRQYTESQRELLEMSVRNDFAQKELTAEKAKLTSAFRDGKIEESAFLKRMTEIKQEQIALTISSGGVNAALKNIEKGAQAGEGSLEALKSELNLSLQTFDKMTAAEKAAASGVGLVEKIKGLTATISEQEQATGRFQRSVGNYQGSAKIIVDALKSVEDEIGLLTKRQKELTAQSGTIGFKIGGANSPEAQLKQVNAQIGFLTTKSKALEQVTGNPKFLNIAGKVGDTNAELKLFGKTLNQLEDAGLKNEQVYKDVQERLAKLTDQLGDTKAATRALASDTRGLDLFAGSVEFAADAMQTAAGASVLFGASEEDAAKATRSLVAIMSVSNGVKGIAKQLTTEGTAANKVYAAIQGQVAIATNVASTATQKFNAILKLSGVGLLIAAIGYLVTNMSDLTGASERLDKGLDGLAGTTDETKESIKEYGDTISDVAEGAITDLEDKIKSLNEELGLVPDEAEKAKVAIQLLEAEIIRVGSGDISLKERLFGSPSDFVDLLEQYDKLQKTIVLFNEKTKRKRQADDLEGSFNAQKAISENEIALVIDQNDRIIKDENSSHAERISALKSNYQQRLSIIEINRQKELVSAGKDEFARKAIESNAQKERVLALRESSELIENENKKRLESEKRSALDLLKFRKGIEKEQSDLVADTDFFSIDKRVSAIKASAQIQSEILKSQYDYDISQKGLATSQKKLIEEKYADDLLKINQASLTKITLLQLAATDKVKQERDKLLSEEDVLLTKRAESEATINKKRIDNLTENREQRLSFIEISANNDLAKQTELFNRGKISKEKFEKEKLKIERNALLEGLAVQIDSNSQLLIAIEENEDKRNGLTASKEKVRLDNVNKSVFDRLNAELDYQSELLKTSGITGQALIDAERKIADARLKIAQAKPQTDDKDIQKIVEGLEKIKSVYLDIADVIGGALNAIATKQKNLIQDQIDMLDAQKAKDIEVANQSITNANERADAITVIEARAAAQRQLLEARQRIIDQRKAQFDKANAIAQIILNSAVAVVKAFGNSIVEGILVAALAAAQLAIAIATPIPKYKFGAGVNGQPVHPGGPAEVGHGKSELVVTPKGQMIKTPSTPVVWNLPKGTKVYPDYSKMIIAATLTKIPEYKEKAHNDTTALEVKSMKKAVVKAIEKIPQPILKTDGQWRKYINGSTRL